MNRSASPPAAATAMVTAPTARPIGTRSLGTPPLDAPPLDARAFAAQAVAGTEGTR